MVSGEIAAPGRRWSSAMASSRPTDARAWCGCGGARRRTRVDLQLEVVAGGNGRRLRARGPWCYASRPAPRPNHARRAPRVESDRGAVAARAARPDLCPMRLRPRKINLDLRVGRLRPDGFHDIATVFQSLALHDVVSVERHDGGLEVVSDAPDVPGGRATCVRGRGAVGSAGRPGGPSGYRITWRSAFRGGGTRRRQRDAAAVLVALARDWNGPSRTLGSARPPPGWGPTCLLPGGRRGARHAGVAICSVRSRIRRRSRWCWCGRRSASPPPASTGCTTR